MSPPRSFRWSRPAAWPTWWARCRRRCRARAPTCGCCCPACRPSPTRCCTRSRCARSAPLFGAGRVTLRLGQLPYSHVPAYVIDAPYLYRRGGSPYQASDGSEWPDNLQRFALLGWVAAHLAAGELDPDWAPEVLHAHDWHAAMACAYMAAHPATRGGIGVHGPQPGLPGPVPARRLSPAGPAVALHGADGLEFHGQLSFMKAGPEVRRPHHHGEPDLCRARSPRTSSAAAWTA